MHKLLRIFVWLPILVNAQTIADSKSRFVNYLNFHGSLNNAVVFTSNAVQIKSPLVTVTLYENELRPFSEHLKSLSTDQQFKLLKWKKNKRLSQKQLDSLTHVSTQPSFQRQPLLKGLRIAIEPGHFCATDEDAHIEQKYLHFKATNGDTIRLYESELTYLTAQLLQSKLQQQGAITYLTRSGKDRTSTGYTYSQITGPKRKFLLDSLLKKETIAAPKAAALLKVSPSAFYKDFFRDFELANRARLINEFKPDFTVIIHYNVDEKNVPWNKHTDNNYTMTFVPGAMTKGDLGKPEGLVNFVRLLISKDLDLSADLSHFTVKAFSNVLHIPIATSKDATYLAENCNTSPKQGVYARNLALCRKINSPLVYGEALYQDNLKESYALMARDTMVDGLLVNKRVAAVAESYYRAIGKFLGIL